MKTVPHRLSATRIVVIYVLLGGGKILFSDKLLGAFVKSAEAITRFSIYKGWCYVIVTAWVLYLLIDRYSRETERYIADLRKTDMALKEAQERLDLALKSSGSGAWDWNIMEDVRVSDDQLNTLFGIKPGEFSGKTEDFYSLVHPDDRERVRDELARIMEAAESDVESETQYRVVWRSACAK